MINDYPQIPLLTEDYQKEIKKTEISKESIEQAITTLKSEDDYENCLLLLLISKYYLLPDALVLIRFEDFGTSKDGKRFMNIFSKTRRRYDVIYIDEETFEIVSEQKRSRLICNKRQYETKRSWRKDFKIKGWFIFSVQRCLIGRKLQNGFNGKISSFNSTTMEIIAVWKRK